MFGAVGPSQDKAAALIMPICNTAAMNHHLSEISSQVAAPRFREGRLCACRGDPRSCRLAPESRSRGSRQYHFVGAAALPPGAQPGRADLALSAQPLARQLGVSQPGGHHGCLRDGLEPVCRRSRLDPLALRRRLGCGCTRSVGAALSNRGLQVESRNFRRSVLRANSLRLRTGNFFVALQGIKSADQGNFRPDQGIPLSSAIWQPPLPTNRIVPTDLERCRGGEQEPRQMLEVTETDLPRMIGLPGLHDGGVASWIT
jgi:hypothetical protein